MRARRLVGIAAGSLLVMGLLAGGMLAERLSALRHPPLLVAGVGLDAQGRPQPVTPSTRFLPGTRVPAGWGAAPVAAEQRARLDAGTIPVVPELGRSPMITAALLDLDTLARPGGVAVAGWHPAWRYVWPRDAAFAASALARTGRTADAQAVLDFLQRVQEPDGTFQARYAADGSVPDDRGIQLDGTGWALWALAEVIRAEADPDRRRALVRRHRPLLDRSSAALARLTGTGRSLPPPSPDYWETPERRVTLATCAVLLTGMRSAADAYATAGDARAGELTGMAEAFQRLVLARFADDGFPRYPGGPPDSVDLGVTLLRTPFAGVRDPRLEQAWRRSAQVLTQPAGGLAPGGSWRPDGVSWTNVTATYAMAEACSQPRARAVARLAWLDRHRTELGTLPEKVRADGAPASVAPLAWTGAAVVITADLLARGCSPATDRG